MENTNNIIYVYRYMWLFKDSDKMCIKVISDCEEAHRKFIKAIQDDERVLKCSRVYLHEYDINMIEMYENIKEDKENGKK